MHSPTPSSLLILRWSTSCKAPVKAVQCSAPTTVTLAAITPGEAAATSNISSVAMLVSVLKDLFWTPASLVSISSRTSRSRYLFKQRINHNHTIGTVLGTLTLRYPIPCTRLAPYAWAGVGAIFGGGERDQLHTQGPPDAFAVNAQTEHFGAETKLLGQFGAGLEFRFARHFGWTNDLSFGVIDGPRNNFGMFRSGVNFAF